MDNLYLFPIRCFYLCFILHYLLTLLCHLNNNYTRIEYLIFFIFCLYSLKKGLFSLFNNGVPVILYVLVGMCGWTYAGLCAWDSPSTPSGCWNWQGGLCPGAFPCAISPQVAFCPFLPAVPVCLSLHCLVWLRPLCPGLWVCIVVDCMEAQGSTIQCLPV